MTAKLHPFGLRQPISTSCAAVVASLIAASPLFFAHPVFSEQPVGSVTAVRNQVHVAHSGQDLVLPVKAGDAVLFLDTYETQAKSRMKLLFEDDSLLTLGETTKLQITENIYNPTENHRRSTLQLLSGRLRVLVGKIFTGTGSKFEIHTPTAVAAARGTYYIVWLFTQNGVLLTGVVDLEGLLEVNNISPNIPGLVRLGPKQYTVVAEAAPPTEAATIDPALLAELLSTTELPDEGSDIFPKEIFQPPLDLIVQPPSVSFIPFGIPLESEKGFHGVPLILQQPPSATTHVIVETQVP